MKTLNGHSKKGRMKTMACRMMFLAALILSFYQNISCQQNISLRARLMYNYYNLDDLKDLQQEGLRQFKERGVGISAVESFPPYWGTQLQALYYITKSDSQKFTIGLFYDFASTGARTHYSDYSGEIKYDYRLRAYTLGIVTGYLFNLTGNLVLNPSFSFPVTSAKLACSSYERLWNKISEEQLSFHNSTIGIMPGISLFYELRRFMLGVSLEYQAIIYQSGYKLESLYGGELKKDENTLVESGLDGLRTGLMFGINF